MSDDCTDFEVGTDLRLSADPLAAFGDSALGHAVLRVLRTCQDAEMPIAAFQDSL
jgi:FXSXX-COOH protein